ncbi:hypothetical protein C1H46_012129 [Malus baccata]|uniref:Uncharacterized protein n=1 Tax=Malus baccata TaxID=106549 RepID=A0A540MTZ9_MALBA|nr:hypothetical protein C1H46_012129 [Malus baccata]
MDIKTFYDSILIAIFIEEDEIVVGTGSCGQIMHADMERKRAWVESTEREETSDENQSNMDGKRGLIWEADGGVDKGEK